MMLQGVRILAVPLNAHASGRGLESEIGRRTQATHGRKLCFCENHLNQTVVRELAQVLHVCLQLRRGQFIQDVFLAFLFARPR